MTIRHLSATEASRSDSMPKADFVNPHKRIELPPQQARCWILPIESILAAPDPVRHHQFQPKCCLADLQRDKKSSYPKLECSDKPIHRNDINRCVGCRSKHNHLGLPKEQLDEARSFWKTEMV